MSKTVKFFGPYNANGQLSNFYPSEIKMEDKKIYPTVEHYYQSMKFVGSNDAFAEKVRQASTPALAKKMGGTREVKLRFDWEEKKLGIMREALLAKFIQHSFLKEFLLSTQSKHLIENSPYDSYWGAGKSGKGQNQMGILLMELRENLK